MFNKQNQNQEANNPSMTPGRQGGLTFDSDDEYGQGQGSGADVLDYLLADGAASNNASQTSVGSNDPQNSVQGQTQSASSKPDNLSNGARRTPDDSFVGGPVKAPEKTPLQEKHEAKTKQAIHDYGIAGGAIQGVKNLGDSLAHGIHGASNVIFGHKGTDVIGHGFAKDSKQMGEAMKKSPKLDTASMAAAEKGADPSLEVNAENNREALSQKAMSNQKSASREKSAQADKGGLSL